LATGPFQEQAVGQPEKHPQNPGRVGVTHPAAVIVERNIQALNGDGWLTVYILAPMVGG
jgi:hypothetical protein